MSHTRAGRACARLAIALFPFFQSMALSAHRLDEVLQAAQVSITPTHITMVVYQTPGVEVADRFLGNLDTNGDNAISGEEGRAFAQRVVDQFALDLDGSVLPVSLERSEYPLVPIMRGGEGSVRIEARAMVPALSVGRHALTFTNNFDPGQAVYLANAMLPRDPEFAIFEQARDAQQRTLRIEFGVSEPPRHWVWWLVLALLGAAGVFVASKASRVR
jgi:hypothetical protein